MRRLPRTDARRLRISRDRNGVVTLLIGAPYRRRGPFLDAGLEAALIDAAEEIDHDETARLVLLRSVGPAFCLGAEHLAEAPRPLLSGARPDGVEAIAGLRVPVVAVLAGDALDAGLELALAADLRLAARGVSLGLTQVPRGELPVRGGTQRLPRLVGRALATRMILLGERISAAHAARIGLVQRVAGAAEIDGLARKLAVEMTRRAPIAQRLAKEALRAALDLPLQEGLRLEGDLYVLLQTTRDRDEGIAAFRESRRPRFVGR